MSEIRCQGWKAQGWESGMGSGAGFRSAAIREGEGKKANGDHPQVGAQAGLGLHWRGRWHLRSRDEAVLTPGLDTPPRRAPTRDSRDHLTMNPSQFWERGHSYRGENWESPGQSEG